jgi:hypothetical protein
MCLHALSSFQRTGFPPDNDRAVVRRTFQDYGKASPLSTPFAHRCAVSRRPRPAIRGGGACRRTKKLLPHRAQEQSSAATCRGLARVSPGRTPTSGARSRQMRLYDPAGVPVNRASRSTSRSTYRDVHLSPRFTCVVTAPLMWGRASALLDAARAGLKARPTGGHYLEGPPEGGPERSILRRDSRGLKGQACASWRGACAG